ncbi:MAG: hypothetical protein E7480_04725 [Ruminococcaceae bacterium]|nr:hypothetical protein [Oscillospiraceae bacterium]
MKSKKIRFLSALVSGVLLLSCVFALAASPVSAEASVAKVISRVTGEWSIDFVLDKNIEFTGANIHTDYAELNATPDYALIEEVGGKILINGIPLKYANSPYLPRVSVQYIEGSNQSNIHFDLYKQDGVAQSYDGKNYTIEFLPGLVLGNSEIEAGIHTLTDGNWTFTKTATVSHVETVSITENEITFKAYFSENIGVNQINAQASDTAYPELRTDILSKFYFQNESVQALQTAAGHEYQPVISFVSFEGEATYMQIILATSGPAAFSADSNYMFAIEEGFTVNGYNILPARFEFSKNTQEWSVPVLKTGDISSTEYEIHIMLNKNVGLDLVGVHTPYTDVNTNADPSYELVNMLQKYVYVNGTPIGTASHRWLPRISIVSAGSTNSRLTFSVYSEGGNSMSFDPAGNYSIEFKEGIILNGYHLAPAEYTMTAGVWTSNVEEEPVELIPVSLTGASNAMSDDTNYFILHIGLSQAIVDSTQVNLQASPDISVKNQVREAFVFNGMNLGDKIAETGNEYCAMISVSENGFAVWIDAVNAFNMSASNDMSFEITKNIAINGYEIPAGKYVYSVAAGGWTMFCDANLDNTVNVLDLISARNVLIGKEASALSAQAMDYDRNGTSDLLDLLNIKALLLA